MSKKLSKIKRLELSDKELKAYISGVVDSVDEQTAIQLELYELINSLYMKYTSDKEIIRVLKLRDTELSDYNSKKLINMALEFFNSDTELTKQAYRNIYADRIEKASLVVLQNATCSKDMEIYANMIIQAAALRQLDKEDAFELPEGLFDKRPIYYTDDPTKLGYDKANIQEVRALIDSYGDAHDLTKMEKEKIIAEAEGFALDQLKHVNNEQDSSKQ